MMNEQEINERIMKLQTKIDELKRLNAKLWELPQSREDEILKKYIQVESIPKVLKYLKDQGYTKENGLKYTANDISAIIQSQDFSADKIIVKCPRYLCL